MFLVSVNVTVINLDNMTDAWRGVSSSNRPYTALSMNAYNGEDTRQLWIYDDEGGLDLWHFLHIADGPTRCINLVPHDFVEGASKDESK